jgi:large repetitive protein
MTRFLRIGAVALVLPGLAACAPAVHTSYSAAPGDTVRTEMVAPGVRHEYRWEAAGPWAIHVADAELATCGLGVRTVKAMDRVAGRETTTQLAAHLSARSGRPVVVAVNGDFFTLRAPQGVPLGAQVVDGEPLHANSGRPVFGMTADARPWFGVDRITASVRTAQGASFPLGRVDARPDTMRLALYNHYVGETTPADTGAVEVVASIVRRAPAAGDTMRVVVRLVDTSSAGVVLGTNDVVLAGKGQGAAYLRSSVTIGDTMAIAVRWNDAPAPIAELVGGGTHLMRDGRSLAPFTGGADTVRHPRTAVGTTPDGRMLLVVVDGRQGKYSAGMTLAELTALMTRLGAVNALNLDGGGSSAMVVNGRVVNRPSDPTGERPVANALAVVGAVPGTCR